MRMASRVPVRVRAACVLALLTRSKNSGHRGRGSRGAVCDRAREAVELRDEKNLGIGVIKNVERTLQSSPSKRCAAGPGVFTDDAQQTSTATFAFGSDRCALGRVATNSPASMAVIRAARHRRTLAAHLNGDPCACALSGAGMEAMIVFTANFTAL